MCVCVAPQNRLCVGDCSSPVIAALSFACSGADMTCFRAPCDRSPQTRIKQRISQPADWQLFRLRGTECVVFGLTSATSRRRDRLRPLKGSVRVREFGRVSYFGTGRLVNYLSEIYFLCQSFFLFLEDQVIVDHGWTVRHDFTKTCFSCQEVFDSM